MRVLTMAGLGLLVAAGVAQGQHAGQYEFGAFGSYTRYDDAFNLAAKVGGGVRLGYFLSDRLGLEADVVFQPRYQFGPQASMEPLIGAVSLSFNALSGERNIVYLLAGYSLLDFGNANPYRFSDGGIHAGIGDRLFLSDGVALRLEARGIYSPSSNASFTTKSATHMLALAGLSFFHREGPGKDTDGDHVVDRKDKCPATPLGAIVDVRGCPSDADGDAVFEGLDQCADTPHGATVDAKGCPSDGDADKVLDGLDQCADTPAGATVDAKGCPADLDGDGVFDGLDQCPDTPVGATVDAKGCPSDSDTDKVLDGIDKCPATPVGATVDATGCPSDADADTVLDGIDKCPDTPAGTKVDATGCPLPAAADTDHDGVIDPSDRCPGTPLGARVDEQGCTILFQEERAGAPGAPARPTLILRGVTFQTGRSALKPESFVVLNEVAASLVANPEIRIEIAGYTDSTGSAAVNLRLSGARAIAVRAYLASKGVSPDRMIARGYGKENPVAPNSTADGRAQNRRVELHKLP
jgi:outer membrane protein OmpA-like peptidoglycan-associated protein